jgi:hypothetical protein
MRRACAPGRCVALSVAAWVLASVGVLSAPARAEPDPKSYWHVNEIKTGMKGVGRTVMVGTKIDEFEAEVLGVMRDVSPGRDMVLCRLKGCRLEHSGIIQGMSGSPIYIDGKLLGAVAFAWEFAKDPIAGVTPFEQMVQYTRGNERRLAAEGGGGGPVRSGAWNGSLLIDGDEILNQLAPTREATGLMAGMRPIAMPVCAAGFTPRSLAFLSEKLGPIGMTAMAGGMASDEVVRQEGDKPLEPGAPLSIALVTGDFDLSGIGTVTHVEGDRVYGFGHPMMSLGACEFPMMTGFIHTVYPRASVSMKMGSPLKVVGVVDTDVSTGVAGRVGKMPDMLPISLKVRTGRYGEPHAYHVQTVREPNLLPMLILSVLANAIDTEGNLPDELTAHVTTTIKLAGFDPITIDDTFSGPRYAGNNGPAALYSTTAAIVNLLVRNNMGPIRVEGIESATEILPGRTVGQLESVRLASDRVEHGQPLKLFVTVKPFKGPRQTLELSLAVPADLPEGAYEVDICDMASSLRRKLRNDPQLLEPRDLAGVVRAIRMQTEPKRTTLYVHVPLPGRGLAVRGQALPNLPGSVRAVFANTRQTPDPAIRSELVASLETPWVLEGTETLRFHIVKDAGLSIRD